MVGQNWFVYPVENGVELVIDATDDASYEQALAAFVTHYTDYNLLTEYSMDGGEVLHFVPAIVDAPEPMLESPAPVAQNVPAPRERTEAESRAAHPAGKGRRIPRQPEIF
ncbi:MAG: hypothetical protein ACT4QF_00015 [Sporichthyaceae bacterium]|jgi:hypothetical protein